MNSLAERSLKLSSHGQYENVFLLLVVNNVHKIQRLIVTLYTLGIDAT